MKYSADTAQKIKTIAKAVHDHTGLKIIATGLYGSVMRGYADSNSDIDICLLVERPVSDYLGITQNPYFLGNAEIRRAAFLEFSHKISKQTGISAMVSLVDARELLIGLMTNSPFSHCAYEYFQDNNPDVDLLYKDVVEHYAHPSNKIFRVGNNIRKHITAYGAQINNNDSSSAYRKERSYLSILWHVHRLLAYISGDTINVRDMNSLIEYNRPIWTERIPEAFSSLAVGVYKARIHRNHFDLPLGVSYEASQELIKAANRAMQLGSEYLKEHPAQVFSSDDQAIELIDLYNTLLDLKETT